MEIIGEDLHPMNQSFIQAIETLDQASLTKIAVAQVDAGATALVVNLGSSKKLGRLTPWLVETIQGAINIPLLLSSHVLQQQRALEIHTGTATINAVTASSTSLTKAMETAKYFSANLVVLLVSDHLVPANVDDRLLLANQVIDTANQTGLPLTQLYIDPVICCRPDPASWSLSAGLPDIDMLLETIYLLGELTSPALKTIIGLSNSSVCLAKADRSAFHCRLLPLLAEAGLDAVIMNCHDSNLMTVAKSLQIQHEAA
ncbi:dihydropteroate synthase [Desulfocapsa sp. AH-315-G09]|nr:dihydropteroate synthase [Desulfocapsa sp.]MBN4065650.1 dihydropteroate synthase [Desulfocapsa sp. AH-315-G09]